ncbi:hypothetical protein FOA52_006997 [Chlamydomonas sp. UWO 241]|nr:hypothetical protein FOA52_006997 [Chlamydomonas sp. UWO 241]
MISRRAARPAALLRVLWTALLTLTLQVTAISHAAHARGLSNDVRTQIGNDQRPSDKRINAIAVVGERHCGTAYLTALLSTNLPELDISDELCGPAHSYQLPGGADCPADLTRTLVLVVIRNPYDWAIRMHKKCWCEGGNAAKAGMSLRAFVSAPFPENSPQAWLPLGQQRSVCGNVMQCRALKAINYLNISSWAPNVELVRHESVVLNRSDAGEWLEDLASRWGLELGSRAVKHVEAMAEEKVDVGASPWLSPLTLAADRVLREKVRAVNDAMDLEVERMLGYTQVGDVAPEGLQRMVDELMDERHIDARYQMTGNHS